MKRKWNKKLAVLLAGITALSMGSTFVHAAEGADLSEFVELTMYVIGSESPDHDMVMEKVNEILAEKLNCSLDVKYIGFGEYETKYPLLMSSGEEIDLIYSASWCSQDEMVEQGAFMDITELAPEYAPLISSEQDLEAMKLLGGGAVYYLPSNLRGCSPYGFIVRGDVMEELGYETIGSMEEYLQFLADANTQLGYQCAMTSSVHEIDMTIVRSYYGYDDVNDYRYWVKRDDPEHKVYFIGDVPELQPFLESACDWANAGAWSMSVLSNSDGTRMEEGLAAGRIHNLEQYINLVINHPEEDYRFYLCGDQEYGYKCGTDFMAIPATSENPERALMTLDLLEHDEELYRLMHYGIEGVHYEMDDAGNRVVLDAESFTAENGTWGFYNQDLRLPTAGTPADALEIRANYLENAPITSLWGFSLSTENIKNEYAACENVYSQYYVPISLGYVEYESGMEELNKAMEAAGKDVVIEEIQRQVDEYFASIEG